MGAGIAALLFEYPDRQTRRFSSWHRIREAAAAIVGDAAPPLRIDILGPPAITGARNSAKCRSLPENDERDTSRCGSMSRARCRYLHRFPVSSSFVFCFFCLYPPCTPLHMLNPPFSSRSTVSVPVRAGPAQPCYAEVHTHSPSVDIAATASSTSHRLHCRLRPR